MPLCEKGSDVGLSRSRKMFFCDGCDSGMAERAPGSERRGEKEEYQAENKTKDAQGLIGRGGTGVQEYGGEI
jgi:hypothetical protein